MVQRKVSNKLGIQADQVKTNKLLVNLKPSSLQRQDTKNKGADLKKKMKKSRPTKCSDLDSVGSPNMRRQKPQPGKPPPQPPPDLPITAASPTKKSPVKTSEATPNYMKSTTSSDARKERPQVSSRNLRTLFDSKTSSKKNSNSLKISSGSVHKGARMLARTSSLKLVRTLTKTISFKPARTAASKCSPLILSESLNVQRATCSSTLKDSMFPAYLELSSGATESEGTSIMKVCPYTFCSLNGHHHAPFSPLKSFLSARRRMLKTQRSMKLGCLSPRQSKRINIAIEDNQVEGINFDEKPPNQGTLNNSQKSQVIEEEHMEFFVEIYSKERDTTADINDSSFNHIRPSIDGRPGSYEMEVQVPEILSDESPFSETYSNDDSSRNGDAVSSDMEAAYSQEVDQNKETEEGYACFQAQEESKLGSLSWSGGGESRAITPIYNPEFGFSDMDCEAENYSAIYLDYEADYSRQSSQESDLGHSDKFGSGIIPEVFIFKPDIECFEEIEAGVLKQQSSEEECFDDENISSKAVSCQDFEIEEYVEGLDNQNRGQLGLRVEDETINRINSEDFIDYSKDEYVPVDDTAERIWDLNTRGFHDMTEQTTNKECKGSSESKDEVDNYLSDADGNTSSLNSEAFNLSPRKGKDSESEKNCFEIELIASDAEDGVEDKEQVDPVKGLMEFCISQKDSAEAIKDKLSEDHDGNHLQAIETDGKSDETLRCADLTDETQDHSAHGKCKSNSIENLNFLEENESVSLKSSVSADLEGEETNPKSMDASGTSTENDHQGSHSCQKLAESSKNLKWRTGCKRSLEECKEPKDFNPREPNFLPVEPDLESEKVDLKHQMMDERKNADEWMLDFAIQQAITKLAPARKKKVALLVEAFETVMPIPRFESQLRHSSAAFSHARPIQACN
ncbi:hypothetical protein ACH5RR_001011 [Cinchona calisaya]|uniref:Calmodulin-binding domain-containing protein n=1 Tax=Cinchona calisaya TaxID=153742 RepID=A0ABD3B282_9GENT